MNRVRIIIIVPELTDEETLELKHALEKLVQEKPGATVELNLRPVRQPALR